MADRKRKKAKPLRKAWGGFCDNRLATIEVDTGWGGFGEGSFADVPAIFKSRKKARHRFQDVRRVLVTEE